MEIVMMRDLASATEDKKPIEEVTTLHNSFKTNLDKAEQLFNQ